MSPDRSQRKSARKKTSPVVPARTGPSSDDVHEIVYFLDPATRSSPGRDFVRTLPKSVRATMLVVLGEVAAAPPKRFSGGGYWEAMKKEMSGWYEVRVDGPSRTHYRLFCLIDVSPPESNKPYLVIVAGLSKGFRTTFSKRDYAKVRRLGEVYWSTVPRSVM